MRMPFLKLWLSGSLFVILSSVTMPGTSRLHASDVGHCYTVSNADAYYYADGTPFARTSGSQSFYTYTVEDCVTTSQNEAINTVGNACLQAAVGRGTYGVGYAVVSWSVSWDEAELTSGGPVAQQYDCGDVGPDSTQSDASQR